LKIHYGDELMNVGNVLAEDYTDRAAEAGDEDCILAIGHFYLALAQGIFNIQYVYDPEKIIIGGAISSREDLIVQIYKKLDLIMSLGIIAQVRPVIEPCLFKNDANLLGALFHYLQREKVSFSHTNN
jgi:predicted NBD/HSP70 family sugar kinase